MKMPSRVPPAPKKLTAEGKRLWRDTLSRFEITDTHDLELLGIMCRSLARQREAEDLLTRVGLVCTDRFNQKKPHPAAAIVRDCAQTYMKALVAIGLNLIPPQKGAPR